MIGRAVVANGAVVTTTSWSWRARVSVGPTWAYSGFVKLPTGLTDAVRVAPRSCTALVAAR
jgi:hypothetical protein